MVAIHSDSKIVADHRPIPKEWLRNAAYRRAILARSCGDEGFQAAILERCREDPVWSCNTFAWTFSPKDYEGCPDRPFILYDFQEDALKDLIKAIGRHDTLIEKSRDMGASWLCLRAMYHRWRHFRGQSFLLASRKEEYVDKSGDPKSLFWKLRYFLRTEPAWMAPNVVDIKLHLENMDFESTFDGESTNKDIGTGDRRTAVLLDEFSLVEEGHSVLAATQHVTRCRIFNATPKGAHGAYYERMKKMKETHPEAVLNFHWTVHPERRPGLYTTEGHKPNGTLLFLDRGYRYPSNYRFILDGKTRSPWYDNECDRSPNQKLIDQELDINYHESGWSFFEKSYLDAYAAKWVRPPFMRYEIDGDPSNPQPFLLPMKDGRLRMWILPDAHDVWHFDDDTFVIGIDIATGKGGKMSSNSSASVFNKRTRTKVAHFWSNCINPIEFAQYCVCLGRFFRGRDNKPAFLIWEANGPGGEFGKEVIAQKYMNFFMRESETIILKHKSKEPGWWSGKKEKRMLLANYGKEIKSETIINTCAEAIRECEEYQQSPEGDIFHAGSQDADDLDYGENHGDMVISDALACRGMNDSPFTEERSLADPPYGSFAARRKQWEELRRQGLLKKRY